MATPVPAWRIAVTASAADELGALPDSVRDEAMQIIEDLAEDPLPPGAEPVRKARNRYRIKFYGYRYRLIYDVSEHQRRVIIGRVRIRDRKTYSGMDKW